MRFLTIFLFLTGICFAEEFKVNKNIDPGELVKEIELSTGLILQSESQQGYMNTSGEKIEVKLKDRELTASEKQKIEDTIIFHSPKTEEQKKVEKEQKENILKQKFGWTDEDLKNLKEILRDLKN